MRMDAVALRELQKPLKAAYREDPTAACTSLAGAGRFAGDGITTTVDTFAGPVRAGLHRATGGTGEDACSGDMLLQALVACAGVTLRSVATATGVDVRSATIQATGVFDARGTLGTSREAPVGVTDVVVTADLDTDADDAALHRLAELTERYCVVGQSLLDPPRFLVRRAGTA
jgi:uncharacterized OsmC-like protein